MDTSAFVKYVFPKKHNAQKVGGKDQAASYSSTYSMVLKIRNR
jgi:hypothetical protein